MNTPLARYFIFLFTLLPCSAQASSFWTPPSTDKSIEFLGQIFGTIGNVLIGVQNPLLANVFQVFNYALIGFGVAIASYTVIISTINTAQEGELLGRQWSAAWVPIRSFLGIALLIPTASGYSLIQIFIMKVVVLSIAAADQLWNVINGSIINQQGISGIISVDKIALQNSANALLNSMVCQEVINKDASCGAVTGYKKVIAYKEGDQLWLGIPNNPQYKNLCGSIEVGARPDDIAPGVWSAINFSAFSAAINTLQLTAQSIYTGDSASTVNPTDYVVNSMLGILISAQPSNRPAVPTNDYGWLYAASNYFALIQENKNKNYPAPHFIAGNRAALGNQCNDTIHSYQAQIAQLIPSAQTSSTANQETLKLDTPHLPFAIIGAYNALSAPVRDLTTKIMQYMTTNQGEPISSLRFIGSLILTSTELTLFSIVGIGATIALTFCMYTAILPYCWALGIILSIAVPILVILVVLLWTTGATLGIYLPLLPFIIFSFSALGWFIIVIEAMVAAPIIAIGFSAPSHDFLGRASQSVTLITNVFLRPSLMLVGLVAAIKLANAIISMVNYGFSATVNASSHSLGIFGCVVLITLYMGIVLAIIQECFSLIYYLPDRITRWIGGTPESTHVVRQQAEEVRHYTEKGAEIGGTVMKGTGMMVQEKIGKTVFSNPIKAVVNNILGQ